MGLLTHAIYTRLYDARHLRIEKTVSTIDSDKKKVKLEASFLIGNRQDKSVLVIKIFDVETNSDLQRIFL